MGLNYWKSLFACLMTGQYKWSILFKDFLDQVEHKSKIKCSMTLLEVKHINPGLPSDYLAARWYSGRDSYVCAYPLEDTISYRVAKALSG